MSEHRDQSYYEIALTNRQVMSIFVVLLICILVSFLGGVWLGRGADAAVEVASTQAIVASGAGDEPLEELGFFTRREDDPSADVQPAPRTLSAPEPETADKPQRNGSQASERPGRQKRSAGRASEKPAEPKPSSPEEAKPAATQRPPAAARSEPESRAADPAPAARTEPDAVVIQVFSSNEEPQARRVADQLRKAGYPAVLSPVEVAGRMLYRVRIGPYTDRDEAGVVAESVRRGFKLETWITR